MGIIVCATRGGEGSRAAQRAALDQARAGEHTLELLYVIDLSDLDVVDPTLRDAVLRETHWLGRTLLHIARRRADALADHPSSVAIREGTVHTAILHHLRERRPEMLFLGAPRGTTTNTFGDDEIERFAAEIEAETGVPVVVVRPETMQAET